MRKGFSKFLDILGKIIASIGGGMGMVLCSEPLPETPIWQWLLTIVAFLAIGFILIVIGFGLMTLGDNLGEENEHMEMD